MHVRSRRSTDEDRDAPTRPDTRGTRTWWHVTGATVGAQRLVVNECEVPPGRAHQLHRHPHAEQVVIVLSGEGVHVTEGPRGYRVGPGEIVHIPAGEWHGFANPFAQTVVIATVYGGVADRAGAGYELLPGPPLDVAALADARSRGSST